MEISERGIELLGELEGRESHVYLESAGFQTIGIGHLMTRSELMSGKIWIGGKSVAWRNGLSSDDIDELLRQDVSKAAETVNTFVDVPLSQNQFDALVSFVFNIGGQAFRKSTLRRLLNAGDYASVPEQMRRWHHAGGRDVQGLKNRREKEISLWLEG
jgi:lysozyme